MVGGQGQINKIDGCEGDGQCKGAQWWMLAAICRAALVLRDLTTFVPPEQCQQAMVVGTVDWPVLRAVGRVDCGGGCTLDNCFRLSFVLVDLFVMKLD